MSPAKKLDSTIKKVSANDGHAEGRVAKSIEKQSAKLPSDTFLWLALGSIGLSAGLHLTGQKERANFVGHWAPTILILGLYNKLVKVAGSDQAKPDGRARRRPVTAAS